MAQHIITAAGRRIGELGPEFKDEFFATLLTGAMPDYWRHRRAGNGVDGMILAGSHERGRDGFAGGRRVPPAEPAAGPGPHAAPVGGWAVPAHLARRPAMSAKRQRHGPFAPYGR